MARENIKHRIATTYKELVRTRHTANVQVIDIAKEAGVSRKTFYYHFFDRACLIQWIFRSDIDGLLRNEFPEQKLIFPFESPKDLYPAYCFYARIPDGVRSIDNGRFFEILGSYLQENLSFYQPVSQESNGRALIRPLYGLYSQAIYGDVKFILGGRRLPDSLLRQVVQYYTHAMFSPFFFSLQHGFAAPDLLLPTSMPNINHTSMAHAIENYYNQQNQKFEFFHN